MLKWRVNMELTFLREYILHWKPDWYIQYLPYSATFKLIYPNINLKLFYEEIPPSFSLHKRIFPSPCSLCTPLELYIPSNGVISSLFSHRTFFFTKFHEGTLYFFLPVNSLKKLFRCWHGHFRPCLTYKPLFFYPSSCDELTLLEDHVVSPIYPWTKTWIWTPAGNFFSWKYFVKNLGTHTKW